jgi:hypothetical protein
VPPAGTGSSFPVSKKAPPRPAKPKLDETPDRNEIRSNHIHDNQDDGVRIKGARTRESSAIGFPTTASGRRDILQRRCRRGRRKRTADGTVISATTSGKRPAYQIPNRPGRVDTKVEANFYTAGAKGLVDDSGIRSVVAPGAPRPNKINDTRFLLTRASATGAASDR